MEGGLPTGSQPGAAPQAGTSGTSSEEQLVCRHACPRARISETLIGSDGVPYCVSPECLSWSLTTGCFANMTCLPLKGGPEAFADYSRRPTTIPSVKGIIYT